MAANRISNPVSSPPPVLRPVGRYRIDGFRYQALVTVVTRLRNRIMSTLSERLGRAGAVPPGARSEAVSALVAGRRPNLEADAERIGRQQRDVRLHRAP